MDYITVEQVENAIKTHNISGWKLRSCSICGAPLFYKFANEKIYFDSNCDCSRYWTPLREASYDELVNTFNRQTSENRAAMWEDFIKSGK